MSPQQKIAKVFRREISYKIIKNEAPRAKASGFPERNTEPPSFSPLRVGFSSGECIKKQDAYE